MTFSPPRKGSMDQKEHFCNFDYSSVVKIWNNREDRKDESHSAAGTQVKEMIETGTADKEGQRKGRMFPALTATGSR